MPQVRQPSLFLDRTERAMRTLKFAGKLDVYRRMNGLTIAELSAKVGVHPDTMERLLTGKNAPSAANLKRIEIGLGIQFEARDFEEVL